MISFTMNLRLLCCQFTAIHSAITKRSPDSFTNYDDHLGSFEVPQSHNFDREKIRCSEVFLAGQLLNDKYLVQKEIGSGTFAVVFSATFQGKTYAVKCLEERFKQGPDGEIIEASIMKKLNHKNILRLIDSFTALNRHFLVTEYCESNLLRILLAHQTIDIKEIFTQVLDAVIFMHSQGIFHRDLKPENILIESTKAKTPTVKISDFGLSTMDKISSKFAGTPNYMSPEMMNKQKGMSWAMNDVWSCGAIFKAILTQKLPFKVAPSAALTPSQVNEWKFTDNFSDELIKVFTQVFGPVSSRPTALQFKEMFLQLGNFWTTRKRLRIKIGARGMNNTGLG